MSSMKSVNKAMATVNAVAKKSVKVFGNSLPILSVAVNVADAYKDYGPNLVGIGNRLIRNYTGFSPETGTHSMAAMSKGLGTLVFALAGRALINWLA